MYPKENVVILGIESSCDETAVAVVDSKKNILANEIYSQFDEHREFRGVVPEIASRAHMEKLEALIHSALDKAKISINEIDAVAVTSGPGLIGGLIVGVVYAKAIAYSIAKPLIGINHLEGHALTVKLTNEIAYPYLLLLVSGGHTQLVEVNDVGSYKILGGTIDDAIGEAFDKVAKMLDLGFPGGPAVERYAKEGINNINLPLPLRNQDNCNFSLSGLKTAVRNYIVKKEGLTEQDKRDLCCSFQNTVLEIIKNRLLNAFKQFTADKKELAAKNLVIAGGVASNNFLRENLIIFAKEFGFDVVLPPARLCVDNAAMIAWVGVEKYKRGEFSDMSLSPRSRWPLSEINK